MSNNKLATYHLALISIWTALLLICVFLIIYPIPGTPVSITFSSVLLSSLTAPLLGPLNGTISALIFGWLAPYINPATSIGILTFLAPTMAVLISSLFLFGKWKEATVIFVCQLLIWFMNPFAWYKLMPIVTWQYWPVLTFLTIPPIRNWIINAIISRDEKRLPLALWCLAWIAHIGGDVATGNNIAVWVLGWAGPSFYPWWAPMTLYYAVADTLNCIMGSLIGTAVLLSLKRSRIEIAIDSLTGNDLSIINLKVDFNEDSCKKFSFGFLYGNPLCSFKLFTHRNHRENYIYSYSHNNWRIVSHELLKILNF